MGQLIKYIREDSRFNLVILKQWKKGQRVNTFIRLYPPRNIPTEFHAYGDFINVGKALVKNIL